MSLRPVVSSDYAYFDINVSKAETRRTVYSFTYPKTGKISPEDICIICKKTLNQSTKNQTIWEHRVTVHDEEKASKRICLMHTDCMKRRLKIKPWCPSCKSPFEFHYDAILTFKERAKIVFFDGIEGASTCLKIAFVITSGLVTVSIGDALKTERTYEQIFSMLYETGPYIKTFILTFTAVGALTSIATAHLKRKGGILSSLPWRKGYDSSLLKVISD